jgi:hypothetical protein
MGIWSDGAKDTVSGASSVTLGWFKSALVLGIILLLVWAISGIYNSIFGA